MLEKVCNLFAYGTLMVPEVMTAVIGRTFESEPARLTGYALYRVKRQVYPGIIARPGSAVSGLLYSAIDDYSLQRLDAFESEVYTRRKVRTQTADGRQLTAWAYVIAPAFAHRLSNQGWDLEVFRLCHLSDYLVKVIRECRAV